MDMDDLNDLMRRAIACTDMGETQEAINLYRRMLAIKPDLAMVHFNLGILYKHRCEWQPCRYHNDMATMLNPDEDGAWWNLGIAATAMEDWKTARKAWNRFGLKLPIVDEDPADYLGSTPIRINPQDQAEVVWANRIDPCRAKLLNIPLPESNHRYHDIVLHDGAPNGFRKSGGREYPVFDELELFARSPFETYSVRSPAIANKIFEDLEKRCEARGIGIENWSTQTRMICRQCSEGRPHDHHDHELDKGHAPNSFLIGFASQSGDDLSDVLTAWSEAHGLELSEYAFYPLEDEADSLLSTDSAKPGLKTTIRHQRKTKMLDWLKDQHN